MVDVIMAISFSTMIVVSFKLFDYFKISNLQAITVNYIVACLFGFFTLDNPGIIKEVTSFEWFPNTILIGIMFMVVFNLFALSAQKVGLAITAISSKMSVILPILLGILVFSETAGIWKILGILSALFAFYLTFKKKEKHQFNKKLFFLPFLLFLGNGTNDIMTSFTEQRYQIQTPDEIKMVLNCIFFFSLIVGILVISYHILKGKEHFHYKNIFAGVLLGLFNYGSTYYFFKSLNSYDNAVFFPIFNVSIVSLSALIGLAFFKERLRWVNWLGVCLAILSIITISISL